MTSGLYIWTQTDKGHGHTGRRAHTYGVGVADSVPMEGAPLIQQTNLRAKGARKEARGKREEIKIFRLKSNQNYIPHRKF